MWIKMAQCSKVKSQALYLEFWDGAYMLLEILENEPALRTTQTAKGQNEKLKSD